MTDKPHTYLVKGIADRGSGLPLEACPYLFNAWPAQCWRAGWLYADAVDQSKLPAPPIAKVDKSPKDQGRVAFLRGLEEIDAPYTPEVSPTEYLEWVTGYWEAKGKAAETDTLPGDGDWRGWFCLGVLIWLAIIAGFLAWFFTKP